MALYPEKFPLELIPLPQWCVYKLEDINGKRTKIPYNPTTGNRASTTDPKTWATFKAALAAYQDIGGYNGICFMLTKEAGIVFIDLDNCIIEGKIEPWAEEIVKLFDSYTERSQSGNGLHILVKGTKPGNKCRTTKYPHKVEIYSHSRQCCLTGDVI
jgi:putative DNA primase/helicase